MEELRTEVTTIFLFWQQFDAFLDQGENQIYSGRCACNLSPISVEISVSRMHYSLLRSSPACSYLVAILSSSTVCFVKLSARFLFIQFPREWDTPISSFILRQVMDTENEDKFCAATGAKAPSVSKNAEVYWLCVRISSYFSACIYLYAYVVDADG